MKKFLFIVTVVGVALALAAPAMALKLTSKGYMEVNGHMINNYPVGADHDGTNSWFSMEMIVNPVLHISDKVRIHSKVRIMERNYSGRYSGNKYSSEAAENALSIYGDEQNNFWVQHLYLSFPLAGGTLYVGRMSGGNWATTWADLEENRDRIKYIRKFGKTVFVAVVGKRSEGDGGYPLRDPQNAFLESASDETGYAVGLVIPFSKNFTFKPLLYLIRGQGDDVSRPDGGRDRTIWLQMNQITLKVANFKLDAEVNWLTGEDDTLNWDYKQVTGWADASFGFGPAELGFGGFYLQGTDPNQAGKFELNSVQNTGLTWEPLLLLFSEDMGLLWASTGVYNMSTGADPATPRAWSGYIGGYVRGAYKISDAIKISGILGYLKADELQAGVDDEIGIEADLSLEWKIMANVRYMIDAGFFKPGDYFDNNNVPASVLYSNIGGLEDTNTVYGFRHTIRVEW